MKKVLDESGKSVYHCITELIQKDNRHEKGMRKMAWDLDADRPIYAQLVERIQMQIVSGQYPAGGKLPSVRELAAVAAVNPNTMQKAFAELERSGLIITQRTNGRTVTDDQQKIRDIKEALAQEHVNNFFTKMKELGYTEQEAVELLKEEKLSSDYHEGE